MIAFLVRNRAGFQSSPLLTLGQSTGSSADPKRLRALQDNVKKRRELERHTIGNYGHIYDNVCIEGGRPATWIWAEWNFPKIGYPTWLNAGKNCSDAQDGFAYFYSPQ